MMRFVPALLLMASLLPATAIAADLPTPLGLRGFNLGMTLDEVRQHKFPDPTTDEVRLICSGDELSDKAGMDFPPDKEFGKIGVKRCGFFAIAKGKVSEASMSIGGHNGLVIFLITPKSADPLVSERLYFIIVDTKSVHFGDLEAAYVDRFGSPDVRSRPPNQHRIWLSGHANLFMQDQPPELRIMYTDTKLGRLVDALKEKKAKPGADKL